jgi:hypothetical protein
MTPCIIFPGCILNSGYGQLRVNGKRWQAHRWAWTQANGPIPAGMKVLHRCDNPPCWNVEHLFLGTQRDNMRDMAVKGRAVGNAIGYRSDDNHCHAGHEFTPANTRIERGKRVCRACYRERMLRLSATRDAIYAERSINQ